MSYGKVEAYGETGWFLWRDKRSMSSRLVRELTFKDLAHFVDCFEYKIL